MTKPTSQQMPFLRGRRLYLRSLVEADAQGAYPMWLNDVEVCRGNSHHVFPYTREAALEFIRRSNQRRDELVLAVVLKKSNRHVGNIALQQIHPINRTAEFSILLGECDTWGRGMAREAAHLLLAHGFRTLGLRRIGCGTFARNTAMQKLAQTLGMKEEGRRRAAVFKEGEYLDLVEFGLLREEYEEFQTNPQPP